MLKGVRGGDRTSHCPTLTVDEGLVPPFTGAGGHLPPPPQPAAYGRGPFLLPGRGGRPLPSLAAFTPRAR